MSLTDPVRLGGREAPNRLVFGPHETNLGRGRAIADRHVAYYRRRAEGGAGLIVTEEASVHDSDWPYERAPLAEACGPGWRDVANAVHGTATGSLVVAALGHAGGQGSSAYSQQPLLAPSRVPEVNSREVPKWMEPDDIAAVVEGFGRAARSAAASGLDGVEVNAGQHSLVRQFLSGLTNQRGDDWGTDRLRFAREVLASVRAGLERGAPGAGTILGLRLSCDELAPWAGLTPESACDVAVALAPLVDYLVVVRGSIFTTSATRPDFHEPAGFNLELCGRVRGALRAAGHELPVVLQGSVVDPRQAEAALADQTCELVEMTRAQIADPALGRKHASGVDEQIRPCVLCNQLCQVRDARNPIVSCIVEPSSGHELDDPSPVDDEPLLVLPEPTGADVLVVGGGPAGLEAARVAARRGHRVRLVDSGTFSEGHDAEPVRFPDPATGRPGHSVAGLGGMVARYATDRGARFEDLVWWLVGECARAGVHVDVGTVVTAADLDAATARGEAVVIATGSVDGVKSYDLDDAARASVVTAAEVWTRGRVAEAFTGGSPDDDRHVVVLDPIGGPIGVAVAEALAGGWVVHLVTQDNIAANELARTGDLAPANVRLQQAGVVIERRSIVRAVRAGRTGGSAVTVEVDDRFSGDRRTIDADLVVDAGFRLPDETLFDATGRHHVRAGDCVAPRTVHEAVLEGRRAVLELEARGR